MNRPNQYAIQCRVCQQRVAPRDGWIENVNGQWEGQHNADCGLADDDSAPAATFTPTAEQQTALVHYRTGRDMRIQAGAGTGKTSTLKLLANADRQKRIQYVAFNTKIVEDVTGSMPSNVRANTAHSLAFRDVGKHYSHRLPPRAKRVPTSHIARMLGIDPITVSLGDDTTRTLQPTQLAGLVMKTIANFCKTADLAPTERHVPYIDSIDPRDPLGRRTYRNNDYVRGELMEYVEAAWSDLQARNGQLRFGHDHYLKMWQLSHPVLNVDVIMFDEAQDANPVMAAVIAEQKCQKVYVGDSNQAIYEFTGAVNAMDNLETDLEARLTQSFRFGPAIAAAANEILARLDTTMQITGTPTLDSTTGPCTAVDAILTRTNAAAITAMLTAREAGLKPFLVGGGGEVLAFAYAARDLMNRRPTDHADLSCFATWAEVETFVEQDEQGEDLKLLVDLVKRFGVQVIIDALADMPNECDADLIVSTAHKAKGLEWDRVRLADDFVRVDKEGQPQEATEQELRLQYVACTRARRHLDHTALISRVAP